MNSLTFGDLAVYLFVEKKLDRSCENDYRYRFNAIMTFFDDNQLDFTKKNVNNFLLYGQNKGWSNGNLNKFITMLKTIASYLDLNFMRDYSYFKIKQFKVQTLTEGEVMRVARKKIPFGKQPKQQNYRFKIIILTLALTGMRIGELTKLKWKDYDSECMYLADTKNDESREVPIPHFLRPMIEKLPKYPHNYIFGGAHGRLKDDTVNDVLKQKTALLGLKKDVTAHTLRHTFITIQLRNKQPLSYIAKIVGHKKVETTMKYDHPEKDDLISVVDNNPIAISNMTFDSLRQKFMKDVAIYKKAGFNMQLIDQNNSFSISIQNVKTR